MRSVIVRRISDSGAIPQCPVQATDSAPGPAFLRPPLIPTIQGMAAAMRALQLTMGLPGRRHGQQARHPAVDHPRGDVRRLPMPEFTQKPYSTGQQT
jgi:hypothetical protein